MVHLAQPRIRVCQQRTAGPPPAARRRSVPVQEDLRELIVQMAEESERGVLDGRQSPTGIFGPDEDE